MTAESCLFSLSSNNHRCFHLMVDGPRSVSPPLPHFLIDRAAPLQSNNLQVAPPISAPWRSVPCRAAPSPAPPRPRLLTSLKRSRQRNSRHRYLHARTSSGVSGRDCLCEREAQPDAPRGCFRHQQYSLLDERLSKGWVRGATRDPASRPEHPCSVRCQ